MIPAAISREMASLTPGCRIALKPGFGHGNDQVDPSFERDVRVFVNNLGG